MYEVKEEDLKLSSNFEKANQKILKKKEEIILNNKNENQDTIEALLLFTNNLSYFKELTKGLSLSSKYNLIFKELKKSFPKADDKLLHKHLFKRGYLSYSALNVCNIIFNIMLWVGLYFLFTALFSSNSIFVNLIGVTCGVVFSTILIDEFIVDKD